MIIAHASEGTRPFDTSLVAVGSTLMGRDLGTVLPYAVTGAAKADRVPPSICQGWDL